MDSFETFLGGFEDEMVEKITEIGVDEASGDSVIKEVYKSQIPAYIKRKGGND